MLRHGHGEISQKVHHMNIALHRPATFKDLIAQHNRPSVGIFLCSGDETVAEICAGAGLDFLLIDAEHGAIGLETVQRQLRTIAAYPTVPIVRVAQNDATIIKQYLDAGAQSLIVPMVNDRAQAEAAVAAVRYPPLGIRGIGASLSRSARWNRVGEYMQKADSLITLVVQIETETAVGNAAEIAGTDGVSGVFIGPADLSASMGLLGQQDHPRVVEAVLSTIKACKEAGKFVGVNAFAEPMAQKYLAAGADFVNVAADVSILARHTEAIAAKYINASATAPTESY